MMSKTKIILFTVIVLLFPFCNSLAQQLEKIPGQDSVGGSDLMGYLENLYKFGISITGILALFMIAVGAFSYIVTSAGNASKMIDAKEKITNALVGLVIALTAYLFLYVINPDLVGGTLEGPEEIVGDVISRHSNKAIGGLSDGTKCNYFLTGGSESCSECPLCTDCKNSASMNLTRNDMEKRQYYCGNNWNWPEGNNENGDDNDNDDDGEGNGDNEPPGNPFK